MADAMASSEALCVAAVLIIAAWLERSELPLGREVVRHMLDVDGHTWSVHRAKANWFRIMGLYVFLFGIWYNRFQPRGPAGIDTQLSQADTVEPDNLEE
uniref:Multiple C2 domain-containing protein n=1 Tax=Oryza rufipogon TaxID=4529 RepID=A0A0E0Q8P2_ORYRU